MDPFHPLNATQDRGSNHLRKHGQTLLSPVEEHNGIQTLYLGYNNKRSAMAVVLLKGVIDSIQLLEVLLQLNHLVVRVEEVVRHVFQDLLAQASPIN